MEVLELTAIVRMPPLGHANIIHEDFEQPLCDRTSILGLKRISPQVLGEVIEDSQDPRIPLSILPYTRS